MSDVLTEHFYGRGAFRTIGKFIVHSKMHQGGVAMFAGSIVDEPDGANGEHQMWECEIIVIPIRKHVDRGMFRGLRIDQILTNTHWGNREMWDAPYFIKDGGDADAKT